MMSFLLSNERSPLIVLMESELVYSSIVTLSVLQRDGDLDIRVPSGQKAADSRDPRTPRNGLLKNAAGRRRVSEKSECIQKVRLS